MKIKTTSPDEMARRLATAADLRGDRDGVATKAEVDALRSAHSAGKWTLKAESEALTDGFSQLGGRALHKDVQTLAPPLRALPAAMRGLALELDHLWGDSDGNISAAELDKVARFTVAALPFFTREASDILALADALGYTEAATAAPVANVLSLRLALAQVDQASAKANAPFRGLLDEAIRESETLGVPEMLRDATRHSPRYHSLSVLEHTAYAVKAVNALTAAAGIAFPEAAPVMLLHDVGKIIDRQLWTEDDGALEGYSFKNHEAVGAEWLTLRGLDPKMVFHVEHHGSYRKLDADAIRALCETPERLGQAMVVYLADTLAKGNEPAQVDGFQAEIPKVKALLREAGIDAETVLAAFTTLRDTWYTEK